MPARRTGTEPVSERDAGVPASETPMPMKEKPSSTCQAGELSSHSSSMVRKASRQNT